MESNSNESLSHPLLVLLPCLPRLREFCRLTDEPLRDLSLCKTGVKALTWF